MALCFWKQIGQKYVIEGWNFILLTTGWDGSSSGTLEIGDCAGMITNVSVPDIWHRVEQISWTDFPHSFRPLTSRTSSPGWRAPLLSAAPPLTILPMTTLSPSFLTVAPRGSLCLVILTTLVLVLVPVDCSAAVCLSRVHISARHFFHGNPPCWCE